MKLYVVYFYDGYEYGPPEEIFQTQEAADNYVMGLNSPEYYSIEELELE